MIVLIGLALLIVGGVILGISLYETSVLSTTSSHVTQVSTNEWRSDTINVNSSGVLTITTSATTGDFGLIHASDLSVVNSTNIANYRVEYNNTDTAGSLNAFVYEQVSGPYYFIVFSSSQPTLTYVFLTTEAEIFAAVMIVGSGIAFVGLIMAIIGAILKKKVEPIDEFI